MEFIFDQNRNTVGGLNGGHSFDDFKNNSPIARSVTRKPVSSVEEIEISGQRPKRRRKTATKSPVKYVSKAKKASRRTSARFEMSWTKFGWTVCACLMLRMIFMDSGIIDYYKMDESISNKINGLSLVKKENLEVEAEIRKIKTSPKYQRKMAREHLGVISSNEYLVIFAKDS